MNKHYVFMFFCALSVVSAPLHSILGMVALSVPALALLWGLAWAENVPQRLLRRF